jgi:mannose-1-phosphate guanylyltransferase
MILSAGLGTRLRPLTEELPKPLCPVGDRPILAHIVAQLRRGGVGRVVVNVHHHAVAFDDGALGALELPVAVSREAEILGTAGGVRGAESLLDPGALVVWNGDILLDLDVAALLEAHGRSEARATLVVVRRPRGKARSASTPRATWCACAGSSSAKRSRAPISLELKRSAPSCAPSSPRAAAWWGMSTCPPFGAANACARSPCPAPFSDIGEPRAYLAANLAWLARTGARAFVAAGAEVAQAVRLVDTLVGAGARVEGEGELRRCVVWPGARVRAPLADTIVSRRFVVPVGVG